MKLYDYIMDNYPSLSSYALQTGIPYAKLKRWCDRGAITRNDLIFFPSVTIPYDANLEPMTALKTHVAKRYDGNVSAAAKGMQRHRNQIAQWLKADAIIIDNRVYLPKGLV